MGSDQPPVYGQSRRGGVVLGLSQAPAFRPVAGLNAEHAKHQAALLHTLSERDKNDLRTDYVLPGFGVTLRIVVMRTRSAGDVTAYFQDLLSKAQALFGKHGMRLSVRDLTNVAMANVDGPVTGSEEIDNAIKQAQGGGDSRIHLKVIFCARQSANSTGSGADAGDTFRDANGTPYIFINTQVENPDHITLAHEIGHASCRLEHETRHIIQRYGGGVEAYLNAHGIQADNNFMSDTNKRTRCDMFAFQVNAMSVSAFSTFTTDT